MSDAFARVGPGVVAIDTEYVRPRLDAAHLIVDDGRAVFVDVGTHFSLPNLLSALEAERLDVEAVDAVLLTHIHLDHAGGAGELIARLPRAKVWVHPRGAAHLIDPSKLIAATKAVYGAASYAKLYGDIWAVPAERVATLEDDARITVGSRTLEAMHTPGHALHHVCFVDRDAGAVFTGDTFGLSYREFDTAAGEFILPTTSPTQFDPQQLHASIERILATGSRHAYLTHYSRVEHLAKLGSELHADLDAYVAIARAVAHHPDRVDRMTRLLFDHASSRLDAHGFSGDDALRHAILDLDIGLNAAGLHSWLSREFA